MKRLLFLGVLLGLPFTAAAADREWSSAELPRTLTKGHFGSQFNFELQNFRGPYLPEVVAKAALQFGLIDRWQLNLELREDFIFYTNSIALVNQLELLKDTDSFYSLTVTAFFRYRLLVDRSQEFSGKLVLNRGFIDDQLHLGLNVFTEGFNTTELTYGTAFNTTMHLLPNWSVGVEEQLRLSNSTWSHPDILMGGVMLINIRTDPIPVYYMYHRSRIWKTGRAIHAVDADIRFMKGVTDKAPNWILSFGISLSL